MPELSLPPSLLPQFDSIIPSTSPDATITIRVMSHAHDLWRVLRLATHSAHAIAIDDFLQQLKLTQRALKNDLISWTVNPEQRRPNRRRNLRVMLAKTAGSVEDLMERLEAARTGLYPSQYGFTRIFTTRPKPENITISTVLTHDGVRMGIESQIEITKRMLEAVLKEAERWM